MKIQSLNGTWMRRIGCGEEKEQDVPYSALAVGRSVCRRMFTPERTFSRLFLKLDGITYHAVVSLNGEVLGEMLPYCEYEFEITDRVRAGENELTVELEDLQLPFGPTAGWENFGGIIRDVSLIYREENYIADVFFKSTLCRDYRDARVTVDVTTDRPTDGEMQIELFDSEGTCVLSYRQSAGVSEEKYVSDIRLWSPDSPVLYRLCVTFLENGSASARRYRFLRGRQIPLREIRTFFVAGVLSAVCQALPSACRGDVQEGQRADKGSRKTDRGFSRPFFCCLTYLLSRVP